MATERQATAPQRPIRFWPVWIVLVLQATTLILTITPSINNFARFVAMMMGPLICLVFFLAWLFFASRLPRREKWLFFAAMVFSMGFAALVSHEMTRLTLWIYAVPFAMFIIVGGLYSGRTLTRVHRNVAIVIGTALIFGSLTLFRLEGFTGAYLPELVWRWSPTAEAKLSGADSSQDPRVAWNETNVPWPGFRGPNRDGRVHDFKRRLDWQSAPPREAWRISVGPGWSSFARVSGRLYTQEQRGEEEVIICYNAENGESIWQYGVTRRFDEVVSGPGPRATPTYADGKIFALGAMAVLSALDAETGELMWKRDLMAEVNAPLPVWGFSSSPLVIDDKVVVYAGGSGDNGLIAYAVATGEPVWQTRSQGMNFSSAQRITIDDRTLILFADGSGLIALRPDDGTIAWRFKPSEYSGAPMVQTQQIGTNSLIVPLGDGIGVARLEVKFTNDTWVIEESWSSNRLKPSFNGFLYHEGHLYGFDQNIFACIDAETGKRLWKGGRYGFGQTLLLKASGQIIVLAENGDVVLLTADPSGHQELARIEMLKGKTWNHPILADGRLIVRNGKEAVSLVL